MATALRFGVIFALMQFVWLIGEYLVGLHTTYINLHPTYTNLILIPSIAIMIGVSLLPSIAYRIDPKLSVGASLNAMYGKLRSEVAVNNITDNISSQDAVLDFKFVREDIIEAQPSLQGTTKVSESA